MLRLVTHASVPARQAQFDADTLSLVELLTNVIKGLCAYFVQAQVVGYLNLQDEEHTEHRRLSVIESAEFVIYEASIHTRTHIRTHTSSTRKPPSTLRITVTSL